MEAKAKPAVLSWNPEKHRWIDTRTGGEYVLTGHSLALRAENLSVITNAGDALRDTPLAPLCTQIRGTARTADERQYISVVGNPARGALDRRQYRNRVLEITIYDIETRGGDLASWGEWYHGVQPEGYAASIEIILQGRMRCAVLHYQEASDPGSEMAVQEGWSVFIAIPADLIAQLATGVRDGRIATLNVWTRWGNLYIDQPHTDPGGWFVLPDHAAIGYVSALQWTEPPPEGQQGLTSTAKIAASVARVEATLTRSLIKINRWLLVLAALLALELLLRR